MLPDYIAKTVSNPWAVGFAVYAVLTKAGLESKTAE